MKLLELTHVSMSLRLHGVLHPILRDLDFSVSSGECIALVGANGCGKSQCMKTLLHLNREGRTLTGSILWKGTDITSYTEKQMRELRHHHIAMMFQDPKASLDPLRTIQKQLQDCILPRPSKKAERDQQCIDLLHQVKLTDAKRILRAYPHELSLGMCQRICLAMMLGSKAELWIIDEATSSLDASIQADILQLLFDLQKQRQTAIIFITHDLRLIPGHFDRVCTMDQGRIVETCDAKTLFREPHGAITQALVDAVLRLSEYS